jgi:phospho-N-acetylmuramoyl-pentapeptide-transferase
VKLIELVTVCVVAGFVLGLAACAILVRLLPRCQFKQVAYEDAPQTHRGKTGTPTMGGICFAVTTLPLFFTWGRPFVGELELLVLGCAAIGFIDDFLSIRQGKNQGLRARTKFLATALIAIIFLRLATMSNGFFPLDVVFHAGAYVLAVPHWLWLILGILAISGAVHAVNLTDGLDGLAAGTMIPPLGVLAAIALSSALWAPAQAALLTIGACIAFLAYNRYPARMFMGDTGSLALGGLLAGVAILTGEMLLLLIIGGVFVAETLSVIIQVAYFKMTKGKRIFKMSPLHHHFELLGWPETTVTRRFVVASLVLSLVGLAIVR